jgi:hypothetical protein
VALVHGRAVVAGATLVTGGVVVTVIRRADVDGADVVGSTTDGVARVVGVGVGVGVGVSGPRYGCGTGSGGIADVLDDPGAKPITAVSTSRTPSAVSANTYHGGRFPGPAVRPSTPIAPP